MCRGIRTANRALTMEQNYPLKPVTYPMCTPERCTGEFESFTGQSLSAFN